MGRPLAPCPSGRLAYRLVLIECLVFARSALNLKRPVSRSCGSPLWAFVVVVKTIVGKSGRDEQDHAEELLHAPFADEETYDLRVQGKHFERRHLPQPTSHVAEETASMVKVCPQAVVP